jgi:hypothetical protein
MIGSTRLVITRRDRDEPYTSPCRTTTATCRCCYLLLVRVRLLLLFFTRSAAMSQTALRRAEPHATSSLDMRQRRPRTLAKQPLSRHTLFYSFISKTLNTPPWILQFACVGRRIASTASYHAGTLRGWS